MTPEEKEVEKADEAYHYALVALGLKVIGEALNEWAAVSLSNPASLGKYTVAAQAIILNYRRKARQLSVAHSRLVRALLVGATFEDPEFPGSGNTLGDLRKDFVDLLAEQGVPRPLKARAWPDSFEVGVEELDGLSECVSSRADWLDRELTTTFDILLGKELDRKVEDLPGEDKPNRKEKERELDLNVGSRITSAAERIALNGARENDADVIQFDRKALGWIRYHDPEKSDHPCGWCSMLMTRGFLSGGIYTSEQKALYDSDGEKYHTGCHCKAEKIYRKSQLDSPKYGEHKKLAQEYREFTNEWGRSGDDLIRAWDRHIRSKKKVSEKLADTTATQEEAA